MTHGLGIHSLRVGQFLIHFFRRHVFFAPLSNSFRSTDAGGMVTIFNQVTNARQAKFLQGSEGWVGNESAVQGQGVVEGAYIPKTHPGPRGVIARKALFYDIGGQR